MNCCNYNRVIMWDREEHFLLHLLGAEVVVSVGFYTVVNVLRANCREEGWTRGGEGVSEVWGRHSYYAALRKDCRGRLPFIRGKHGAADKLLLHVRSPLHRDWIDRGSQKIGKRRMGREKEGMRKEGKDRKKNEYCAEMMWNSYYVDYLQACELSCSVHSIFFDSLRKSIRYCRARFRLCIMCDILSKISRLRRCWGRDLNMQYLLY